jgi:tetratricopeptide (TPR) repeat protein
MKKVIKYGILVIALLINATALTIAQINMHEILSGRKITIADSTRLAHYLSGYGQVSGSGQYYINRKLYLDSALSVVPWSAFLWFEKSYPLLFGGKYDIGAPYLDSAVKYNKEEYVGYRGYIKCIFEKRCREAIPDLKEAQRLNGEGHLEDHPYDFFIGLCYLQLNKFDSAANLFTNSISKVRNEHGWQMIHYLDWFYLGIALFEKDDFPRAIDCFDSCLRSYNHFSDAKFYKSWCLKEMKNYQPALEIMTEAGKDYKDGYTINDDNARYEPYPYQVNRYYIDESLQILNRKIKQPAQK